MYVGCECVRVNVSRMRVRASEYELYECMQVSVSGMRVSVNRYECM